MQGLSAPKQVPLRNGHQSPHLLPRFPWQQRRRRPPLRWQIGWLRVPLAWQQQRWPIIVS
jgi:hypothetical protein